MPSRSDHLDKPIVRKLLDAAELVFEERGFAGARIDDIAARAGMAKSHVYYHFAGKQQILDDLITLRIAEILSEKDALMAGLGELDPSTITNVIGRAVTQLLVPRAAFIRIALLESLGTGTDTNPAVEAIEPLLLRVARPLLEDTASRFEALGYAIDRDSFVSDIFHFGIVPIAVHVALGERWAVALGVSSERADELFLSRLTDLQAFNVAHLPRRQIEKHTNGEDPQ